MDIQLQLSEEYQDKLKKLKLYLEASYSAPGCRPEYATDADLIKDIIDELYTHMKMTDLGHQILNW